jgi:N-ethylmaleimide reductase
MSTKTIFSSYKLGNITLANRVVMAPMTRSRAIGNIPNELMAKYYEQRATAGLNITEGVSPSPNGLGYSRIPGIFSKEQVEGWRKITAAVHAKGGKIFAQLMHTGRIGHTLNLPIGARLIAPSPVTAPGQMWTDQQGMQAHPIPEALTTAEVASTKQEYIQAARNAIEAGFDGIELHGANGYLLEQFLSPHTNQRNDAYGGNVENRSRFIIEVAKEISNLIGKEKVGIRLSPYGTFNDMPHYAEIDATYNYLAEELNKIGIAYIHLVDQSAGGALEVQSKIKKDIRKRFDNTLILSGGYDLNRAEEDLLSRSADLVAFGRPFITNPDLVQRFIHQHPLNTALDPSTFYSPGEKGYTDFPIYEKRETVV